MSKIKALFLFLFRLAYTLFAITAMPLLVVVEFFDSLFHLDARRLMEVYRFYFHYFYIGKDKNGEYCYSNPFDCLIGRKTRIINYK